MGRLISMSGQEVTDPLLTCTGEVPLESYHVIADPVLPRVTGYRHFATNMDLAIYEQLDDSFKGKMPDQGSPSLGQEIRGIAR